MNKNIILLTEEGLDTMSNWDIYLTGAYEDWEDPYYSELDYLIVKKFRKLKKEHEDFYYEMLKRIIE